MYAQNLKLAAADRVNWKGEEAGVHLGTEPKDPDEGKVLVTAAYFARKVGKKVKRVETRQHTLKVGDTHASIARSVPGVKAAELKAAHPKLTSGETVDLRVHSEKVEIFLQRVSGAGVGARLFVVVETTGLKGQKLTIEILGGNNITFVSPERVVTVLVEEAEKTSLTATVGSYTSKKEYTNAAQFANQGIAEFTLAPRKRRG